MSTAVYSQSYAADALRPGALSASNGSRSNTQLQAVIQQESQYVEQQPMEEQYNSLFCRALYDYEAQDPSALSFRTDDIIEVLTQQPSGWWDGLLGEERGWFPSNYVTIISDEEAEAAFSQAESTTVDGGNQEIHQANVAENGSHEAGPNSQSDNEEWLENEMYRHGVQDSHRVTKSNGSQPSDFWIPEVTMDGQIYYVNTQTGQRSRDLPQEAEDEVSDSDLAGLTSQGTSRSGTSAGLAFGPSDVESGPEDAPISVRKNGTQEKWVKHLADDGISHYYQSSLDGRIQWTAPAELTNSVGRDATFSSGVSRQPDISSRMSVYSDDSDIQPFDHLQAPRPRKQNGTPRPQQASDARSVPNQAVVLELTAAERVAKALQASLEPPAPVGISELSTAATNAIQTVIDNVRSNARVPSLGDGDQQMDQLIHSTVLAARNLLYVAAAPTTQIPSSVIPGGKKGLNNPPTSSQSPLKPAQRKVTATLSRLVLSARAIQYDSGSQVADTLNRIETDSEELDRAVAAFVNEVERHEFDEPNGEKKSRKRLQGVFSTENLGMGLVGGGAAGSWKGFGYISLGDEASLPKKVFGAEVTSGISVSLERIQDGLSNLQQLVKLPTENSVTQIRASVQELVTRISSFLSLVTDIHIARHVDIDGIQPGGDATTNTQYTDSVDKARQLVRKLEAVVQTVYDDSSSLFMAAQILRDNDRGFERAESGSAFSTLDGLAFTLRTNLDAIKQTLEGLLAVGYEQAEIASGDYNGSIDWRMSRLSIVDDHMQEPLLSEEKSADEYDSENGDIVDINMAFNRPSVKKKKSTADASFDSYQTLANMSDTSSLPGRESELSLDQTLVTATSSSGYRDNYDDAGLFDDDDLPKPTSRPAGGSKLTRLLGDEYADKMAIDLQPWYLRPNYSPSDIIIEADGSVKGGTVAALVERLTAHEQAADTTFSKAFLMTYKSFTTLDDLFDLLVARFRIQPPDNLTQSEREEWGKLKQHVIQMRVINTMKSMVTDDGVLEKEDLVILDRMKEFISSDEVSRFAAAKHLMIQIERLQAQGGEVKPLMTTILGPPPPPIVPKSKKLKLLDIDPIELARQLTILESGLYQKIKPMECLQRAREQKTDNVDNIATVIQTSNRIACWVAECVLSKEDSRRRAQVVKHLINVADRCRVLNNFSTMIAITSGLNTPPIRRLKRTWEQVNQRFMAQFGACEMTIDSNKNFTKYRTLMASVTPPCVPFIGVFLSTLTFIQDGNSDNLPGGLVNFRKRQMASEVINDIKRWQAQPFNFQTLLPVQNYINDSLNSFTDTRASSDHFWALSLEREPREREDEKMARLLQESGFL